MYAQTPASAPAPKTAAPQEPDEVEPPEEDESLKPKEYTFNPLQAEKELKVGAFHFKRGNWKGAAMRFEEATKWNPSLAEAWRRLGEVREKVFDDPGAIAAYKRYLETAGDDAKEAKQVKAVQKRLGELAKYQARGK